jgi:hypothetical protein
MRRNMQLVTHHARPRAKVSVILLDWGVRESFHSLHYLDRQTLPRDEYEIIWIEFYDRKPAQLLEITSNGRRPLIDKWLVMGYPADVCYHKHRMYNAGLLLAEGGICVFCDSDAVFTPTFIASLVQGFKDFPGSVLHLDQVRNYSKAYYPFNYPSIEDVLGDGCANWSGKTTIGLDGHADMLHGVNYGACMAARREDLLAIGGADEHLDYLGYICGPYEMTFRLVNHGLREQWLRNEYIYHVWHPNTSGCNTEYKGPDDGRGMSLTALSVRQSGRVMPLQENAAIRYLRDGNEAGTEELLSLLVREDDDAWMLSRLPSPPQPEVAPERPFGFSITFFAGVWYGLPSAAGPFDPVKFKNQQYEVLLVGTSKQELLAQIKERVVRGPTLVWRVLRRLPLIRRVASLARRFLVSAGVRRRWNVLSPAYSDFPRLIEENFCGYNILLHRDLWYGLRQDEGEFTLQKLHNNGYRACMTADSRMAIETRICRTVGWMGRAKSLARTFLATCLPWKGRFASAPRGARARGAA